MRRRKWHETLKEARKHLEELKKTSLMYDNYEVYHKRGSKRKKPTLCVAICNG